MIVRVPHPRDLYRRWRCSRDRCVDNDVVLVPPSDRHWTIRYYGCMRCGRTYHATVATNFTRTILWPDEYARAVEAAEIQRRIDEGFEYFRGRGFL